MQDLPPKLPLTPNRPRRSILTALMVLMMLFVCSGVLLVLPTGFIGPVMVFGGVLFFGMIGFHYLVWGRWMTRILQDETMDEHDHD